MYVLLCFLVCSLHSICNVEQNACVESVYAQLEKELSPSLHAPWRDVLFDGSQVIKEHAGCPFCREMALNNDEDFFILGRCKHALVMLNPFPYSKGHLLIIPFQHVASLKDLSSEARAEIMELCSVSLEILEEVYAIPGANVGFNIGRIAGASVPDHVHMHVVPRTVYSSFIHIIGHTSVAVWTMRDVYNTLKPYFDKKLQ